MSGILWWFGCQTMDHNYFFVGITHSNKYFESRLDSYWYFNIQVVGDVINTQAWVYYLSMTVRVSLDRWGFRLFKLLLLSRFSIHLLWASQHSLYLRGLINIQYWDNCKFILTKAKKYGKLISHSTILT